MTKETTETVQHGVGAGMVRVEGSCPECGVRSLFVAVGQYVTCANLNCDDPCAPSRALGVTFPTPKRLPNACSACLDCYHPSFGPNTDGDPCPWCRDCGCAESEHVTFPTGSSGVDQ